MSYFQAIYKYRQIFPAAGLFGLAVLFLKGPYHIPHAVGVLALAIGLCFKSNICRILSIGVFGFFFALPIIIYFLGKDYGFGDISADSSVYQITFKFITLNVIPGIYIWLLWKPFKKETKN